MSTRNKFAALGYPSDSQEVSKNWLNLIKNKSLSMIEEAKNKKNKKRKERKDRKNKISKAKNENSVKNVDKIEIDSLIFKSKNSKIVALDCEFVGIGNLGDEDMLARVSVVSYNGEVLYDTFVSPSEPIVDYRTKYSGVTKESLVNAVPFKEAQTKVADLIKGRVILGHGLTNDLRVLMLQHPAKMIRDSSLYKPLRTSNPQKKPKLKELVEFHLGKEIHKETHDSVEDARCCMEIYKMFQKRWEKDLACKMYKSGKKK